MRKIIGDLSLNSTVNEGYVYFIENHNDDGELVEIKVGRSANYHARFKEHVKKYSEFGFNLTLLGAIKSDDCVTLETEIHRKLKDFAVRKEWFRACNQVSDLLRHDYGLTTSCKIRLDKIRLDKNRKEKDLGDKAAFDEMFEQFWLAGMAKKNKAKAKTIFNRLLKSKGDKAQDFTSQLIMDVKRRLAVNQLGFESMHPTTYLNGERWEDDITAPTEIQNGQTNGRPVKETARQRYERESAIIAASYQPGGSNASRQDYSAHDQNVLIEVDSNQVGQRGIPNF